MTCATIPTNPEFQWLSQQSTKSTNTKTLDFARFTIQELIQQECCIGSADYPVDRPSRLVQIECRKPGCRCVLKNEYALALKIIPGVTLVQGEWIAPNALVSHDKDRFGSLNSIQPCSNRNVHNLPSAYPNLSSNKDSELSNHHHHVVLTSCCPSWFELVHRSVSGPKDSGPYFCPDVPVWSTGKAIWHAKPQFILLRKEICCMFATKAQPFVTSSTDLLKKDDRSLLTLDADNPGQLGAGTVLRLLDCRLCRLAHKDGLDSMNSYRLIARHRSKPVSMLQFAVVGDKALAAVASSVTAIQPHDALKWFADGPRLVYVPLDSKSILASPVHFPVHSSNGISQSQAGEPRTSNQGVHSLLSLLSLYQIPLVTRPIIGLRPNEWFFIGRFPGDRSSEFDHFEPVSSAQQPLLHLFACYHGDLIFLEPLSECAGPICYSANRNTSNQMANGRFFVVTPDMLANHNFLVADEDTCQSHSRELETHAFRVSHFLAACHPAQGLGYLLKHLEDTTHSSSIGPSHTPLTRTLGPISNQMNTAAFQAALASVAAVAALASGKCDNLPSDQLNEIQPNVLNNMMMCSSTTDVSDMYRSASCLGGNANQFTRSSISSSLLASEADEMNALCDELEDIYFYVRNGHFPAHSRSMSSLPHQHANLDSVHGLPQSSAPISPKFLEPSPVSRSNPKKRQQSTGQILETSVKTVDNRSPNYYPSKVTSKAPVVMIRANPMDQTVSKAKVSITPPMHQCNKLVNVPIHSGPMTPNNSTYDSGIRFLHNPQPRKPTGTQISHPHQLNSNHTGYVQIPTDPHQFPGFSNSRNPVDNFSPSRIRTSPYVTTTRERAMSNSYGPTSMGEGSPFAVIPTMVQSSGQVGVLSKSGDCPRPNQPTKSMPYTDLRPHSSMQITQTDTRLQPPAVMATSVNLMLNRPMNQFHHHRQHQGTAVRTCDTSNYYVRGQRADPVQNRCVQMHTKCDSNGTSTRQLSLSTSHLCPVSLANANQVSAPMTVSINPSVDQIQDISRPCPERPSTDELQPRSLSSCQKVYYAPDTASQLSSQYTNVQQPNLIKWVHVPPSMPLLRQSRLCQSTVISSSRLEDLPDSKRVQTCPRYKPNSEFEPIQHGPEHPDQPNHDHYYTVVPTSLNSHPPTHPTKSPNSSPDTGIGAESAYEQAALVLSPHSRHNMPIWMTDSSPYCATSKPPVLTPIHSNAPFVYGKKQHQIYQF